MYQQSSFMSYQKAGDGPPKVYQASSATKSGPGGVSITHFPAICVFTFCSFNALTVWSIICMDHCLHSWVETAVEEMTYVVLKSSQNCGC